MLYGGCSRKLCFKRSHLKKGFFRVIFLGTLPNKGNCIIGHMVNPNIFYRHKGIFKTCFSLNFIYLSE